MVTEQQWQRITQLVIDHAEGGYYHPSMLPRFNARSQAVLKASGETMFGLDRKHGAALSIYPEWATFWRMIDFDRTRNPLRWKHEYRGGALEGELKQLAATIMYRWFNTLSKRYILVGSMDEIAADERLLIHFSYASWNGEGWFKRYANALNKAIQKYEGNKELIFQEAFKERSQAVKIIGGVRTIIPNTAIRQQANNLLPLFKKIAA